VFQITGMLAKPAPPSSLYMTVSSSLSQIQEKEGTQKRRQKTPPPINSDIISAVQSPFLHTARKFNDRQFSQRNLAKNDYSDLFLVSHTIQKTTDPGEQPSKPRRSSLKKESSQQSFSRLEILKLIKEKILRNDLQFGNSHGKTQRINTVKNCLTIS
jgi:hypothetical protein